jgi:membrane complex biogenesis BtpA family protein
MGTELLKEVFHTTKPIIGMVHFPPLPGTPLYDDRKGVEGIFEWVLRDLEALLEAGVDGVLFGNEGDRPYQLRVDVASTATMAYVIGRLREEVTIPFGVDVLWDPYATIALAKATGARFVREVFTNAYASDMGIWNTDVASVLRYRHLLHADDVLLFFNINAEFAAPLAPRPLEVVARSARFSSLADVICVSGPITGEEVRVEDLARVKEAVPDTPVFANTGVRVDNVARILEVADGAVVGTSLKRDGVTWNAVDPERAKRFMEVVRRIRGEQAG